MALDSEGWTILEPSPDSRLVYVSSSSGSALNDGLSENSPKDSFKSAKSRMRTGMPDWMLLKRGDTFEELFDWRYAGGGVGRECVLTAYGTGPRPIIKNNRWQMQRDMDFSHFAMVGIELYAAYNDPASPDYGLGTATSGVIILGTTGDNLLFEDNLIRFFDTNVTIKRFRQFADLTNVVFRRNVVLDGGSFGITTQFIDGLLIEENMFDRNGWVAQDVFYQGAYLIESHHVTVRNNIFAHSGNFGVKLSSDTLLGSTNFSVTDNLLYKSSIGIGHADANDLNYDPTIDFAHQSGVLSNNVTLDPGKPTQGAIQTFGWIFVNMDDVTVEGNVFGDNVEYYGGGEAIRVNDNGELSNDIRITDNVIHNWNSLVYDSSGSYILNPDLIENLVETNNFPTGVPYVDPGRNILSYSLLNGGPNSEVDFLNLIHAQEKGNWNTAYLASAINDYIRAGYHMARYWAQLNGNVVERVIVCDDAAWIDTRLGGTWVETFIGNTVKQYAGIGFGCDNHSQYIFAQQWVQPLGSEDAYQPGSYVFHNSAIWQCRVSNCVWEPGVFGWFDPISEVPKWIQPIGAGSEYAINVEVMHGGKQWKCNTPANVWEPGVFGWDDITHIETPEPEYPAWAPWPGSGPLYQGGDRVTHNGLIWEATVGNNVWEPGVFGWIEVTP